jgi:hypothetical protein
MALYLRQNMAEAGVSMTLNAATATVGDTADNTDGKLIYIIRNGSGGAITASATVVNPPSVNDPAYGVLTKTISALNIANNGIGVLGPFPPSVYNNASNQVTVICSAVTSVTVSPVKLP